MISHNCPAKMALTSRFSMKIIVNGEAQEYNTPLTVTSLLQKLNLQTKHVAVEVNLKILDRSDFPTWNLQEGDKIEILSFMGGGSFHQ